MNTFIETLQLTFERSLNAAANSGQQAARAGKSASDCPYSNMSGKQAYAWLSAFQDELLVQRRMK